MAVISSSGQRGSFHWVINALAVLALCVAALPVAVVVVMSFSAGSATHFPPEGLSLKWYQSAIGILSADESGASLSVMTALMTSLLVGALVMAVSIAVAVPLAYSLARRSGKLREWTELFFTLPLVFPLVVLGISFLLLLGSNGLDLDLGIWRLVLPHVTLALPFVLRNCVAAMSGIEREIEEAAISLGASPLKAAIDVVVPLMKPGILAGLIFAFIISFNEFTVTFFMYTVDLGTVPIWMYARTVSSLDPTTLALSTLVILFDALLIVLIDRVVARNGSLF